MDPTGAINFNAYRQHLDQPKPSGTIGGTGGLEGDTEIDMIALDADHSLADYAAALNGPSYAELMELADEMKVLEKALQTELTTGDLIQTVNGVHSANESLIQQLPPGQCQNTARAVASQLLNAEPPVPSTGVPAAPVLTNTVTTQQKVKAALLVLGTGLGTGLLVAGAVHSGASANPNFKTAEGVEFVTGLTSGTAALVMSIIAACWAAHGGAKKL